MKVKEWVILSPRVYLCVCRVVTATLDPYNLIIYDIHTDSVYTGGGVIQESVFMGGGV